MGPKDSLPHSQVAEYCVTPGRIVKWDTICPATLLHDPITQTNSHLVDGPDVFCSALLRDGPACCILLVSDPSIVYILLGWKEIQCREKETEPYVGMYRSFILKDKLKMK